MRFLYVAPRYHTNQIPIMKGLTENGHEVKFFSHYAGKIEDYSYVVPDVIGYSGLYKVIDDIYVKLLHKNNPKAIDKKLLIGFPPVFRLNRKLKAYRPDVVIIRERSVYSMVTYVLCKLHRYQTILYNQSPVYEEVKQDFAHCVVRALTPRVRMTPVMGNPNAGIPKEKGAFFVPFVMDVQSASDKRTYCDNGVIHIFTVGKYEKRKNLLMMLEVIKELAEQYPIKLTIAGECSTGFHKEYYKRLEDYISKESLGEKVTLLTNQSREQMNEIYAKTDLFVLPSTLEPASISQLEAMSFSVPVICSDTNGSACYVQSGHNGFLFRDNKKDSLKEAVEKILRDKDLLVRMGHNSYRDVKEKYQFSNYFEGIMECIHYMEG